MYYGDSYWVNPVGGYRPSRDYHSRRQTTRCQKVGCDEPTRRDKPYCPEHIEESGYVQEVLAKLAGKELEEDFAENRPADLSNYLQSVERSYTVDDILLALRLHGTKSKDWLRKQLNLSAEAMDAYLRYLVSKGLVSTKKDRKRKGRVFITLVERRNPTQPILEPSYFVFQNRKSGAYFTEEELIALLMDLQIGERIFIYVKGETPHVEGYGTDRGVWKVVLNDIIKFTPTELIDFFKRLDETRNFR